MRVCLSPVDFFRCALAAWVCVFFSGIVFGAGEPKKEVRTDPLRTFQFSFQSDAVHEAIRNQLTFLHKVAPGVEEVGAQHAVADMFMDQGNYSDAARLLKVLAETPTKDPYFRYSILMRLAVCQMHLGRYNDAVGYYTAVMEGPCAGVGAGIHDRAGGGPAFRGGFGGGLPSIPGGGGALSRVQIPSALHASHGADSMASPEVPGGLGLAVARRPQPRQPVFRGPLLSPTEAVPGGLRGVSADYAGTSRTRSGPTGRALSWGKPFTPKGDFLLAAHTFSEIYLAHRSREWDNLALYRLACCDIRLKKFKDAEARLDQLVVRKLDPSLAANAQFLLTDALGRPERVQ
jgi:tetratricopeptide (TPR) repeat protein